MPQILIRLQTHKLIWAFTVQPFLMSNIMWAVTSMLICEQWTSRTVSTILTKLQRGIITKILLFKYIENFTTKNWKLSDKNSNIFHISAQNIDCGYSYSLELPCWGSSNKYPQSMFLSRNKKNNVYPCKPQFYCIKVGFKGVKII